VRSVLLRRQSGRRLSSEHFGWAEGSCVTSRRFHEAALRVIVSPSWAQLFVITGEVVRNRPPFSGIAGVGKGDDDDDKEALERA
jgi:hypothetical protein